MKVMWGSFKECWIVGWTVEFSEDWSSRNEDSIALSSKAFSNNNKIVVIYLYLYLFVFNFVINKINFHEFKLYIQEPNIENARVRNI